MLFTFEQWRNSEKINPLKFVRADSSAIGHFQGICKMEQLRRVD